MLAGTLLAGCKRQPSHTNQRQLQGLVSVLDIGVEQRGWVAGVVERGESTMLRWALIFFVVALLAALFGFGGIAGAAAGIAKLLFIGFLIVAVIALIMGVAGGRRVL
jgi:uncharacterized membrane protein YtjA (UPF0391 family)